jgi:4-amino-4-deoxy-L-arabinose transferase-like glycosyltransferase
MSRRRIVITALVLAFAVALGHLTYQAFLSSTVAADYQVGGDVEALCGAKGSETQKHLYLRRLLFLPHRPRHAWIQVVGRDRIRLYVNGKFVEGESLDGFPVAVVADLVPYLHIGRNVIAIDAAQFTLQEPPAIAVDGAYVLDDLDEVEHRLRPDDQWRCSSVFERKGPWWFAPEFDDRSWPTAQRRQCDLGSKLKHPPRAVSAANVGSWITPPAAVDGQATVRREFTVDGRPKHAWLRVTTTSDYRLAVNGTLIDQQESQLATTIAVPAVRRTYDITQFVRRGHNALAIAATSNTGSPHLLADLEVEDSAGALSRVGTDEHWLGRAGLPLDWRRVRLSSTEGWHACQADAGELSLPPWEYRRDTVAVTLPLRLVARRLAEELAVVAVIFVLTLLACRLAERYVLARAGGPQDAFRGTAVYLALVPATVAIAGGVLAAYDPRIARQDVYRGLWVFLAVASVPAQWLLLALVGQVQLPGLCAYVRELGKVPRLGFTALTMIALVIIGYWLRMGYVNDEPIHWDEVDVYKATQGVFQKGFPSNQLPNMPRSYANTSELLYYYNAFTEIFTKSDIYIVRYPALLWSVLTIILMYYLGRSLFSRAVGLVAATLYSFSPVIIAMCTFGRYFGHLQFLSMLTVYFFWLTIRGRGPINRWALWLTGITFLATYLSWEGGALIAPGMILAVLVYRRGHLKPLLSDPAVWAAMMVAAMGVGLQLCHRTLQQTQQLWYGISLSDTQLKPMWQYPNYDVLFYVWESSWNQDTFLPMLLGLGGGLLLSIRHAYRQGTRFLLLIFVPNCMLMASLLPNATWRYIHQVVPLLILLAAATIVALAHSLTILIRRVDVPVLWKGYGRAVQVAMVLTLIVLSGGLLIELRDMPMFRVEAYSVRTFRFPNHQGPVEYVRDHIQEGDVVITTEPHHVAHIMRFHGKPGMSVDYWPAIVLVLPATLNDVQDLPLDRREGTTVIPTYEALQEVFARHPRIWYIVQPGAESRNGSVVSNFFRENMEVAYEDWQSIVLFRGGNHRPAFLRAKDEKALGEAQANYLP